MNIDAKLPAWLIAKVDQRMALIEESLDGMPIGRDMTIIMSPLTEPPEGATPALLEQWDRTCDKCATFSPPDWNFYTGHLLRSMRNGMQVAITFGVCQTCYDRMPK